MTVTLEDIEIGLIHQHPNNPRHDVGNVDDLARSIKAKGMLTPVKLVRADNDFGFTLIDGHRRLAAAQKAKLKTVPALVDDAETDPAAQLEEMIVQGVERDNLSPVEEAEGYQALLEFPGYDVAKITKVTGRSAKIVKSRLTLATLPDATKAKVHTGQVSLADAAKLAEFADDPEMIEHLERQSGPTLTYGVEAARRRKKLIAEATAAGATVLTDTDQRELNYPDARRLGYDVNVDLGPDIIVVCPVGTGYAWYYTTAPKPAEPDAGSGAAEPGRAITSTPDISRYDAGDPVPTSGVDEERKSRQATFEAEEELRRLAREKRETAEAVRLSWSRELLSGPINREASVRNGLRAAIWNLLYEVAPAAFDLLSIADGDVFLPDEAGSPVTEKMELPNLVALCVLSAMASPTQTTLEDVDRAETWTLKSTVAYFDFLVSMGYEMNDVDTEQLAAVEARLQWQAEADAALAEGAE